MNVREPRFEAVLLAEDCDEDMVEFERLQGRGITLEDRLDEQLAGLAALGSGVDNDGAPGEYIHDEAARWAYYPWREVAVRVLGPAGFDRLRLDRNRNKITAEEQARLRSAAVGVVGLSVGHTVAYTLALEGACGVLRLADHDILELSNLNRIPASVLDLGVNKAVIAARRIAELDPYLPVEVWTEGVTPESVEDFFEGLDLVIDECDSFDVKLSIRTCAARRRVPVVMHTSDRGLLDVERFDLDGEQQPFHGLLGDLDPETLRTLSNRDKVPYVLRLLDAKQISERLAASLLEVGESLEAWPQLGADVGLGGVTVATAVRGIVLGGSVASGRCRVDLDLRLTVPEPQFPVPTEPETTQPNENTWSDSVAAVVDAATRAPSGGNSQPWTIVVEPTRLTFALATEPEPVLMDLYRRGSCVALGAALHNARVAAAAHGILGPHTVVDGPDEARPGIPLARLELGTGSDHEFAAFYGPMLARATNRFPSDDHTITHGELEAMHAAADLVDGRIRILTGSNDLAAIAEILSESDRVRYLDRPLRTEMIGELRWPGDSHPESGIEVVSLGLDTAESAMLEVVLRHDALDRLGEWGLGGGLGKMTRDRVLGSAGLVAVFTDRRSGADYIRAGATVESVWIAAQAVGLAVQPVSPIFLYADTRADFERLSRDHSDVLQVLQRNFADMLQVDEDDGIALLLRIGRTTAGPVRSRRRADRVLRADGLLLR